MNPGAIPSFALYGEDGWTSPPGFGHIETIAARSLLHDWTIAPHRHDSAVQVLIVAAGHADVTIDGAALAIAAPGYLAIAPGSVHGFRFATGTAGHVLTLGPHFAARARGPEDPLATLLSQGGQGALAGDAAARAARLAADMIALGDDGAEHGAITDPLFDALAEALVRTLIGNARTAGALPGDRRLALFRHMVETHLGEHRPLDFYARSIGTTVRTLTRLTVAHLGHSPQALINRRLALEAERRLRYTGASVAAVAADLGFADPSYFSRFYLRMTGRRPQADRLAGGLKAG